MNIIDDLVSSLSGDSLVREVYTCVFWTAVVSKHCGLSSTFRDEHPHHGMVRGVGDLRNKSALELAEYAKSDNLLEASIGMATINSLIDIDETKCDVENALDVLIEKGEGKDIAVVGHFPWIPKLRQVARKLWVLEQRPQAGDLPAEAAEDILPKADVVAITGTSLINHTAEKLLDLAKGSFVVMVGPTSPLSPVLFDWGVDVVSGTKVVEPEKMLRSISEGAIFPQVQGVKLMNMRNR
ncbi:MAG: DUF364 domain-containing protein [Dehalococcoidia bacterium]|nr:DUF364 domain-containing protein [Dehalococcoidia bacterium]